MYSLPEVLGSHQEQKTFADWMIEINGDLAAEGLTPLSLEDGRIEWLESGYENGLVVWTLKGRACDLHKLWSWIYNGCCDCMFNRRTMTDLMEESEQVIFLQIETLASEQNTVEYNIDQALEEF